MTFVRPAYVIAVESGLARSCKSVLKATLPPPLFEMLDPTDAALGRVRLARIVPLQSSPALEKLLPVVNAPGYPMSRAERGFLSDARATTRIRRQPLRILFMGRLDKQKDIDRVCALYRMLNDSAPRMTLSLAARAIVEEDNRALPWPAATRFLGAVRGPAAITQLLSQTDILILPSLYEGLPLSVLEAQRCGVVPIVTQAGAVRDGHNGFVVSQQDCVEQMAARILQLDGDREMHAKMARVAAETSRSFGQATQGLRDWLDSRMAVRLASVGIRTTGLTSKPNSFYLQ